MLIQSIKTKLNNRRKTSQVKDCAYNLDTVQNAAYSLM